MSQTSEDNIEIIPSIAAATVGDSPSPKLPFEPNLSLEIKQRDPLVAPAIGEPSTKMQLLSRLMQELPQDSISQDPNLREFMGMHMGLANATVDDNPSAPTYNWDILSKAFEYIYNLYLEDLQDINSQFESLDIKRSIWLESVSRLDGNRAESRIQIVESWISNSRFKLNTMKNDLDTSIEVIKTTLNKFN